MSNMRELTIDGMIDGIADAFADMAEQAFADTDGGSDVVKLPLDCDGMTVHLGDMMAVTDNAFYVEEMHLISDADGGYYWQISDNAGSLIKAKNLHHVGEDTLEGILLPCPFCGGEAVAMHMNYGEGYLPEVQTVWGVWCRSDLNAGYHHGHYIDNYATEKDAVQAWNRIAR